MARGTRVAALLAELAIRPDRSAEQIALGLAELRGAALKLGQLLSLLGDGLISTELAEALALIRDRASWMSFPIVEAILRRELGRERRAVLSRVDPEPLAAASMGQVHAVRTRDGRDLVLKVQFPGVARSIASDLDLAALLLRALEVPIRSKDLELLLAGLGHALRREADYRAEARSTADYREWLREDPDFQVPAVHGDLSTRRVLASDRIRGLPIEDLRSPEHPRRLRDHLGESVLGLALRELFGARRVQTDPNPANYLFVPAVSRIALLDFGATLRPTRALVSGYRALLAAAVEGADRDLEAAAVALGFLAGDESPDARGTWLRLARCAAEPLRASGAYDFPGSDLARRVGELAAAAYRGAELPIPAAEVLLLQRKLAGTFSLLQHIGARADAAAAYRRHVR